MGLLDNAFNTSNTLANQRRGVATAASERQGSGSVYLAAQGGERMKQGTRSMLGIQDPVIAQQELLQGILQKHSNMKTPEDMMAAANDLQNSGFTEYAQKMIENATNAKNAQTTPATGTTYMKDLRDIAKFQLACDFNDPECAKKAQELWLDQKRAGVDERYQGKYAEADALAFSEDLTTSTLAYKDANAYESTINQSLGFLDQGLYTGTGAETINKIKKAGIAFGFVDPGANANAEQFRVNSMKAIMAWVQKTKGAISEAEMQLFADASEGLGRTVAGNKLILLTAKGIVEYQQKIHKERIKWMEKTDNPTRLKWQAHMIEWNEINGNMLPSAEAIAAALNPDPADLEAIVEDDSVEISIVPQGD